MNSKSSHPSSSQQNVVVSSGEAAPKPTPSSKRFVFSLLLENKGSTARDHLANERTFLAWLRTSLALVTIGVAITQINKLTPSKPKDPDSLRKEIEQRFQLVLGTFYMCSGILFVLFGLTRYFYIQTQLTRGMFPASRFTIVLGVILLLVICITLIYTFVGDLIL
ncbi:hypothetical protein DSO57_1019167 [Entomophthora muscae]|uniref:Uncharacterized protein n=1 Tax=Entomophthora muscae TaxID=34485 RepID=A0ACC2RV63_9FUNG|nr:hypothetical protein DSO57_1019167 [Entomophthora muscae]